MSNRVAVQRRTRTPLPITCLMLALATSSAAHESDHGRVGRVHFPIACEAGAQKAFDRAMALYYNYFWAPALTALEEAEFHDPGCAMVHWAVALVKMDNILSTPPTPKAVSEGTAVISKAVALGGKTARERDLIAGVEAFYREASKTSPRQRLQAYEETMRQAHVRHPADPEVAILYAVALQAVHDEADKTYAKPLLSASILKQAAERVPQHPGVWHFLVHAYDYPAIAHHGVDAARRYAALAADTPHALHMPSHIFTRLGLWSESMASNLRSARACDTPRCELHALDYAVYAYLQLGQDREAAAMVERVAAWPRAETAFGPAHAQASIPGRHALERGRWADAARLTLPAGADQAWRAFPHAESQLVFARAVGAARSGDLAKAAADLGSLARLEDEMRRMKEDYWARQTAFRRLIVAAWIARSEGRNDAAVRLLREAADAEDASEKALVTPGPIAPAREALGELFLELNQPGDAAREFSRALDREPGRLRGHYGAALAAELIGDQRVASMHYRRIAELAPQAARREVAYAKRYLEDNAVR